MSDDRPPGRAARPRSAHRAVVVARATGPVVPPVAPSVTFPVPASGAPWPPPWWRVVAAALVAPPVAVVLVRRRPRARRHLLATLGDTPTP